MLSGNPFDILAIPGNHDEDVYRDHLRFGNDLEILTETPFESRMYGDVEVLGVPFTSSMDEELYSALKEKSGGETQVLLLHCTLDIGFESGAVGEGEGTYFPVTKATLSELGYDYVLAGHIHSTDRILPLENGGRFVYPGSPVSHSTSEEGRRKTVLIDTEEETLSSIDLDTFYYDSYLEMVLPGEEEQTLDQIREWVDRRKDDNCELTIEVDGYIEMGEDEFHDLLEQACKPVEPQDKTRSAKPVLDHPLYQRFMDRLEEMEDVEDSEVVETRVIQVLSKLLAQNKVQPS